MVTFDWRECGEIGEGAQWEEGCGESECLHGCKVIRGGWVGSKVASLQLVRSQFDLELRYLAGSRWERNQPKNKSSKSNSKCFYYLY